MSILNRIFEEVREAARVVSNGYINMHEPGIIVDKGEDFTGHRRFGVHFDEATLSHRSFADMGLLPDGLPSSLKVGDRVLARPVTINVEMLDPVKGQKSYTPTTMAYDCRPVGL